MKKKKKTKRSSYSKTQLCHSFSPTSHLGMHRSYSYRAPFHIFLTRNGWGEERFLFFEDTPGNRSSGGGVGPVAQRIRARGYEPRCRGFESLLAHNRPQREGPFPFGFGSRKIMIGIANPKLWNLGVGLLSKCNGPYFFLLRVIVNEFIFTYSMPRTSSSARLG